MLLEVCQTFQRLGRVSSGILYRERHPVPVGLKRRHGFVQRNLARLAIGREITAQREERTNRKRRTPARA